jgi:hypothetical protein
MAAFSPSLLSLARLMGLSPVDAIALPTVIEVAARKAGLSQQRIIREAFENKPLRDYLGAACRKAMEKVAA